MDQKPSLLNQLISVSWALTRDTEYWKVTFPAIEAGRHGQAQGAWRRRNLAAAKPIAESADRYLFEYAASRKKKTSIENDRRRLVKKLVPALGRMKVNAITRAQISDLHHRMRETPYEANRALSLLHRMFVLAERWGIRPEHSNPAANIDRYPERKRERFLDPEEIRRLFATLDEVERTRTATPHAVQAGSNLDQKSHFQLDAIKHRRAPLDRSRAK